MWHELVGSERDFFKSLIEWDEKVAAQTRQVGCECGGRLDRSDYPRKPRGVPAEWDEAFSRRISFCCAQEGCRRRKTPPSIRFFGRRVYTAALVLACSASWVSAKVALVPLRTVRRWLSYFRFTFPLSQRWRELRTHLMPPVCEVLLPGSLLDRFGTNPGAALLGALSFLRVAPR